MLHSTNWVKSLDAVNVHWKVITTKQFSMMVISHYHFSAVILPRLAGKPGTKFLHGKKVAHQEGCWRQVDMVPRKVRDERSRTQSNSTEFKSKQQNNRTTKAMDARKRLYTYPIDETNPLLAISDEEN